MKTFEQVKKEMKPLIDLCKMSQKELLEYLPKFLAKHAYKGIKRLNKGYIYAKGELPIMLVAHLDTVHSEKVKDVFINMDDLDTLSSPQGLGGDDRCGVYIIKKIIQHGYKPSVLFCCDEEIGCLGAQKFCDRYETLENVNFIVEFDRRGKNDVVRYEDENEKLTRILEKFGWKEDYGSCSDISYLAPHFKVSAVNLSSGYYHEHHLDTTIVFSEVKSIIKRFEVFLESQYINEKIGYIESDYYYSYNNYGYYYGSALKDYKSLYSKSKGSTLIKCDCCNETVNVNEIEYIEGLVCCKDCARQYREANDLVQCEYCGGYNYSDEDVCEYCGCALNDTYKIEGGEDNAEVNKQ